MTNETLAQTANSLNEAIIMTENRNRPSEEPLIVRRCNEFTITGNGSNLEWNKTEWSFLNKLNKHGRDYESKFKILASSAGIYILFHGQDDKITTKSYQDLDKIWNGDVFEVFFHTNPDEGAYFEYEVNALEKQLVLIISNSKNGMGWIPFIEDEKKGYGVNNKVEVLGGPKEVNGLIESWSAEVFISYKSLLFLENVPPVSGAIWNANFYRIDYDSGNMAKWSWSPNIKKSFHELDNFRSIKFE